MRMATHDGRWPSDIPRPCQGSALLPEPALGVEDEGAMCGTICGLIVGAPVRASRVPSHVSRPPPIVGIGPCRFGVPTHKGGLPLGGLVGAIGGDTPCPMRLAHAVSHWRSFTPGMRGY